MTSLARLRNFNQYAALSGWNAAALGADDRLATFVAIKDGLEKTLAEWQDGLAAGRIRPDYEQDGVKYVAVKAYGTQNSGREIRVSDGRWSGTLARTLFKDGGNIPHPIKGAVWLPQYIFSVNKSLDQMANEVEQEITLCGFTDVQAVGYAKSLSKVVECDGSGSRSGRKWAVYPNGEIQDITKKEAAPGFRCPSKNFPGHGVVKVGLGAIADDASLDYKLGGKTFKGVTVWEAEINAWTRKNPCKSMDCINRSTMKVQSFNYCPTTGGVFPPAPPKGFLADLGPAGTAGIVGVAALLLWAIVS